MAKFVTYKHEDVRRKRGLWWLDAIEQVAAETAPALYGDAVVITSGNDGRHSDGSLHYDDKALDIRFMGYRTGAIAVSAGVQRKVAEEWAKRMRKRLGSAFDIVVEANHIHVEYDPR